MKYELTLYKNSENGYASVMETKEGRCWADSMTKYVRASEPLSVEFKPLPVEEVVAAEVAALDQQAAEIRSIAAVQISKIEARKQELLALTHESV